MVDSSKYAVLDVETNGLSCITDDLLSISIYLPDTEKTYNRFLPLEKNNKVVTTKINGIKTKDLKNLVALSQSEVDEMICEYELDKRTVLSFGNLDEKFIRRYFRDHKLDGIDRINFYNFKHDIISSVYSAGAVSKDNLCRALGIDGVQKVHSGINDCKLEWKIYEKLDGGQFLVTQGLVFRLSPDYYVPASYLLTYPNFKRHKDIPDFEFSKVLIKTFNVKSLISTSNNLNGLMIENILFRLCGAVEQNNMVFLSNNKNKLRLLGYIEEYNKNAIPINIDNDGNILYAGQEEKEMKELFEAIQLYKIILENALKDVAHYIKNELFKGEELISQELTINEENKVIALSDISSKSKVLEIKTHQCFNWLKFACQLYFQSKGRETYCLVIDWGHKENDETIPQIQVYEVNVKAQKKVIISEREQFELQKQKYQKMIINPNIKIIKYNGYNNPADLKCDVCGGTFKRKVRAIQTYPNFKCPNCKMNAIKKSAEEDGVKRLQNNKQMKF